MSFDSPSLYTHANGISLLRSRVQVALKMCKGIRIPCMLLWEGLFQLAWAEILHKFDYFARCWERAEEDLPETHEAAAQQIADKLGIVTDGLVKEHQFAVLVPWDIA